MLLPWSWVGREPRRGDGPGSLRSPSCLLCQAVLARRDLAPSGGDRPAEEAIVHKVWTQPAPLPRSRRVWRLFRSPAFLSSRKRGGASGGVCRCPRGVGTGRMRTALPVPLPAIPCPLARPLSGRPAGGATAGTPTRPPVARARSFAASFSSRGRISVVRAGVS